MPWRRPASPWPRGRPSAESRSAGRRAEDTAIWPVGFGDTWAGFLSSPAPCGSRPGVGKRQPAGQRLSLWVKVFVNKDLLAPGHAHSFTHFLWPCSRSTRRAEPSQQSLKHLLAGTF